MTLARLSPSDTGTIVPKWHWNNCCQVTLARLSKITLTWLFPSGTGTVVIKWRYHNCYWVTMAHFSTSDTGMIVPKWHWDDCSHVTLARLFLSSTGSIIPKVHCHSYSQVRLARLFQSGDWLSNLYFFFSAVYSLARFFSNEFNLEKIMQCTRVMALDSYISSRDEILLVSSWIEIHV